MIMTVVIKVQPVCVLYNRTSSVTLEPFWMLVVDPKSHHVFQKNNTDLSLLASRGTGGLNFLKLLGEFFAGGVKVWAITSSW